MKIVFEIIIVFDKKPKISLNHRLLEALFFQRKRETASGHNIPGVHVTNVWRDKVFSVVCSETFLTWHASSRSHEYSVNSTQVVAFVPSAV